MAQTLSKTGIAQSNVIQASHVTQSIDALTGTVAYDITISGSLTTTGSVLVNGRVNVNGAITGSTFTGSFVGFHTGSAALAGNFTGGFTGSALLTGSFTGSFTGSLDGNATTSFYQTSLVANYQPSPGGTFLGPGNLGILAGTATLISGVSPLVSPPILTGKTFQTQYWVTATKASGSTSPTAATLFIEEPTPGGGAFLIKETGASSNDDVNFIIVYLQ